MHDDVNTMKICQEFSYLIQYCCFLFVFYSLLEEGPALIFEPFCFFSAKFSVEKMNQNK